MRPASLYRRQELHSLVEKILSSAANGVLTVNTESESIDFKEEAGRREQGGTLAPGKRENPQAATKLADEVACMANTPRGGALIVGVEDETGRLLGSELDIDWLRGRINRAVGVAPDIEEHNVDGFRVLTIYVAEASEPVSDTKDRLRWRVGTSCEVVDRSEWWLHRDAARGVDPLASRSQYRAGDVCPGALSIARETLGADRTESDHSILRRIGALRSDDYLSGAAALLLTPLDRQMIDGATLDVPGGAVTNRAPYSPGSSLLEQFRSIELFLAASNTAITREHGLQHRFIHRVPQSVVREAVLNAVIHRDYNRSEPTQVQWFDLDSTLVVTSPGGFIHGVDETNLLSNRATRNPALADLFRALGFVDKQGVGVDRMYQAMISLGHRPPSIRQAAGPNVICTLTGGQPLYPVMDLMAALRPKERSADHRISILIYELLHQPFTTVRHLARALQAPEIDADNALLAASQTLFQGHPIVRQYKDAWLLSSAVLKELTSATTDSNPAPYLQYRTPAPPVAYKVALKWVDEFGEVSTGDMAELTGLSRNTARARLEEMSVLRVTGRGRGTVYKR